MVDCLEGDCRLIKSWSLQGGISAHMTGLLLERNGKRSTVVLRRPGAEMLSQNPRVASYEFEVLKALSMHGVKAPQPLFLDESKSIFDTDYIVVEYIEGEPVYAPVNLDSYVQRITDFLLSIHSINADSGIDLSFMTDQRHRLTKEFGKMPGRLDHSLREEELRRILADCYPPARFNRSSLIHGDFWPGNVIFDKEEKSVAGVLDWEDAELGDPLYEIAITRMDLLLVFGVDAMNAFTELYRDGSSIDFTDLPYYDLMAALRPAFKMKEWASAWIDLGRDDITEDTMRSGHRRFVDAALAAIQKS